MLPSHIPESHTIKKQSQRDFFHHYQQFTLLIQNIDKILSGAISKNLEGNEIRKSITLLDQITRDLQCIGAHSSRNNTLEKEEYGQEILGRWKKFREWKSLKETGIQEIKQNGNILELDDVYGALSKILSQDKIIANQGIISLNTSIFHTPKKETRMITSGLGNHIEKVETAEKFTLFCDVFQNMSFPEGEQLSLQDCMIYEEQLEGEGRMRATPYKIIYIPAPIMQTWCISDEIGQAIYIYEGHPLLETIISGMKGGNGESSLQSLIWKRDTKKMKAEMTDVLQNGIQKRIEHIPTEDMKLKLWAQKALMEARVSLDSFGMKYLGDGKWDIREMLGGKKWKDDIGGKKLGSFPSATWNKKNNIGNETGALKSQMHVKDMLISIGYKKEDIIYIKKISDPLEWNEDMIGNEESYKKIARTELEDKKYRIFLDSIGMKYLGDDKWDLREMKCITSWKDYIGGKKLTYFPSATWNRMKNSGKDNGAILNPRHITNMLVSIGYKREDIAEKSYNPLEWDKETDIEEYRKIARTELEDKKYRIFLDSIGMKYLGDGKWDLRKMVGSKLWKDDIGGKKLANFPSGKWNKSQKIGSTENGVLTSPIQIAHMLVSIGYKEENIIQKISDPLEWNEDMIGNEESYKKIARTELEDKKYRIFLDSIGMKYLGDDKWDLREMKPAKDWEKNIGNRKLQSFPSGKWNKSQKIGSTENGVLTSPVHLTNMLISIGYKREDIKL